MNLDKPIVSFLLGFHHGGIYALYTLIGVGIISLNEAGVSAWHYPKLVRSIQQKENLKSKRLFRKYMIENFLSTVILISLVSIIAPIFLEKWAKPDYYEHINSLYVILIGIAVYLMSMPYHYYLYAKHKDGIITLINGVGFFITNSI
jgi:hypothetical protein